MKFKKTMQLYNCETVPPCLPLSPKPLILKHKMSPYYFKGFSHTGKSDKYYSRMKNYLISWIKSPDTGSRFAGNMSWLKVVPADFLLKIMLFLRYDAVFNMKNGKIVGHIFFQWHSKKIKIFSVFVSKELRKGGSILKMFSNLFIYLNTLPEFPDIKVGSGGYVNEKKLLAVVDRLKRLNSTFEVEYLGDYYFRIRKKYVAISP